jgi:hypothetical protein
VHREKGLFKSKCALLLLILPAYCVRRMFGKKHAEGLAEGSHLNVKILDLSHNKALSVAGCILVHFVLEEKARMQ